MPPRRECIFICTVCEPMFAQSVISPEALTNFAREHTRKHSLGTPGSRSRVMTLVSSPKEDHDTPELEGLLRWESHERAQRSEVDLAEEGQEGSGG